MTTKISTSDKSAQSALPGSGFRIERTAKRMKQAAAQALKEAELDITVDQWVILDQLRQQQLNQQEIGRMTYKDAPTVTRIIDLLCNKELTRRESDPEDRRKMRIHLTDAGRQMIEQVEPLILDVRKRAYDGLDGQKLKQLTELLDHIYKNLDTGK